MIDRTCPRAHGESRADARAWETARAREHGEWTAEYWCPFGATMPRYDSGAPWQGREVFFGSEDAWARFVGMTGRNEAVLTLPMIGGPAADWRFNLDGFVVQTVGSDLSKQCYTQLFRDGGVEVVSGKALVKHPSDGGFYASWLEGAVIGSFTSYQRFCRNVGVSPASRACSLRRRSRAGFSVRW